jgi:hypothetical protein
MAASGPAPVARAVTLPGEPTQTSTLALEKGAAALQSFKPVNRMHAHLCAFHFYAYDMGRQVEAHHYCTHYNEEMRQCAIFDTPEPDARLIGIEYIVSERLFKTLPDEEKKFWHSHDYEVTGGILFLPGVPKVAERAALSEVAKTYGKVFHFWQVDKGDSLPLGLPQLMMSFTNDGQLNPALAADVERRFNVSFKDNAEYRKNLTGPDEGVHPNANSWRSGKGLEPASREVDCE